MILLIKKGLKIGRLILFFIFFIALTASDSSGQRDYQADSLQIVFENEYIQELIPLLQQAEESIYVAIYGVVPSESRFFIVNRALNELIRAHERGVKVDCILEYSHKKNYLIRGNLKAKEMLQDAGINVRLNSPNKVMHTKLIVIDDYISILGSHNWTFTAFEENKESSVIIKSSKAAEQFIRYFKRIR